jgi:competence protein ComEC
MGFAALQTPMLQRSIGWVEALLERERSQLALWLPVMLACGIAAWFVAPLRSMWIATIVAGCAVALLGVATGLRRRAGLALALGGLMVSIGCGLVWARAAWVAGPVVAAPVVSQVSGEVLRVERLVAKDNWRLTISPDAALGLPRKVRVSVPLDDLDRAVARGARISVRARLMPPAPPAVPGGYDFARHAWFQGIGATGKALGPVSFTAPAGRAPSLRDRLNAHIATRLGGSAAGIATALATGDQGGMPQADQDAMRASGLAHLLSVSGLHISAVVAAVFFLALRVLALSSWMALRLPLLTISAGFAAAAGIGYTLLTGSEVPTVRSCIAAILVLIGMALGREALTLRLVATGALIVLLLWPESLMGASFQLSFAAITAIVALHDSPAMRRFVPDPGAGWAWRIGRAVLLLLLTGLVVEVALAPIALFHFHKAGLYGALANMIAIPLTTFVIMPLEALALLLDLAGAGAPVWWLVGHALEALVALAHWVAGMPGAVAMLPSVPRGAYALLIGGGLWLLLWRTRMRILGLVPLSAGAVWALAIPAPDLLVTGDGRHMAVRGTDGRMAILRPRSGDYIRDTLAERAAHDGDLDDIDTLGNARCSDDACIVEVAADGRRWRILATRSRAFLNWTEFTGACAASDIVFSDRRLPKACQPRWLRLDPDFLSGTGGLAVDFASGRVETVKLARDDHPWIIAAGRGRGQ